MIGQTIPDSHKREAERHRRETEANRDKIRVIPPGVSGDEHNRVAKSEEMRRRQKRGAAKRNGNKKPAQKREGLPHNKGQLSGVSLEVLTAFKNRGTWAHRSEIAPAVSVEGKALTSVMQRLRNAGHLERSEKREYNSETRDRQFMYRAVR